MNGFKKTARLLATADSAFVFNTIVEGNLPLPSKILSFNLGYATLISFTSVANMSNVNFTIKGKFNNMLITETIIGPNNGSVSTNYFYDTIISITASGDNANALTLVLNVSSIVFFDNINIGLPSSYAPTKYSILASSLTVNDEGWGQGNYFIYGVNGTRPSLLTADMLLPNIVFDPNEPYGFIRAYPKVPYFYIVNDPAHSITQVELQDGYIITTNYPFDSIVVCALNNLISTPTIIEIAQN